MSEYHGGLFNADKESVQQEPNRPLKQVSDFVLEQLPERLEAIGSGRTVVEELSLEAESIVAKIRVSSDTLTNDDMIDLACLDLKMLESGIVHSGGVAGETLTNLVDVLSEFADQPPGITYEEIVLVNPLMDMRTFTAGEVGMSEADFYNGHRIIEAHLGFSILSVKAAIENEGHVASVSSLASLVNSAAEDISKVALITKRIGGKMPKEHFAEFRPFLNTHPYRDLPGPSGAFTAGVPQLDFLLAGNQLPSEYYEYLSERIEYFPRDGRVGIAKAIAMSEQGLSLTGMCERLARPKYLVEAIEGLRNQLLVFRGKHHRAVGEQVPEALRGEKAGTGGQTDVARFLRARIEMIKAIEI